MSVRIVSYNPQLWRYSDAEWGRTKHSFIFSFKNKDNFKDSILSHVNDIDYALYYDDEFGPSFGNDLCIRTLKETGSNGDFDLNFCIEDGYEKLIRDTEVFSIEDYEVFQILKNEK
ncbi:453_t:CDS:2 [Funneliformis caledonium]|uniref:453_t:CDS:1 n=1 Tax=Funneliformis caledonium TaxID=1117310 RepID=A0A9N9DK68_9GLOM|nr:453_t:CDS:2 [Funneliformis caledonium]